ncbi:MAG: Carbon storage regulator [Planctomycetota bacterium]|jgi:carbon storage regulator
MLVLSRKVNQKIVINGNIVVTVVDIRGDNVRLGIQAPRDVSVHREEILRAILQEESLNPGNSNSEKSSQTGAALN